MPGKVPTIGLRQARRIAELPTDERLPLLAEGMPTILKSARSFISAARAMSSFGREATVLLNHGEEEAAKILILLDVVRCPAHRSDRVPRLLDAFYSHISRALYADACGWQPTDIAMLRSYADDSRTSHYVDGPPGGEFVLPNDYNYMREAVLYADLQTTDDGALSWNDPPDIPPALFAAPLVFNVVEALDMAGALSPKGLTIIEAVWSTVDFTNERTSAEKRILIDRTLSRLRSEGSRAPDDRHDDWLIHRGWQMPMYDLDLKIMKADVAQLTADRDAARRSEEF